MQAPGRCPRCGYPLRYDRGRYRCEFCGFPNTKPPLSQSVRNLERTLRSKMESLLDNRSGRQYDRVILQYPYAARPSTCVSCGLRIPFGVQACPYCAAPQTVPHTSQQPVPSSVPVDAGDQQVLDYIVAHNGTISISQAARDLSISADSLRLTIERLKTSGFLKPT